MSNDTIKSKIRIIKPILDAVSEDEAKLPKERVYGYQASTQGRIKLASAVSGQLRLMHGTSNIATYQPDSPLAKLNDTHAEHTLYLTRADASPEGEKPADGVPYIALSSTQLKQCQSSVQVVYDSRYLTSDEAMNILKLRAQLSVKGVNRAVLAKKASHLLVSGNVQQFFMMDKEASLVPELNAEGSLARRPRERIEFFTVFPELSGIGAADYHHYCRFGKFKHRAAQLMYKANVREILRLSLKHASDQGYAFSMVMPNNFLRGLNDEHQNLAKTLFLEAVIDVAKEKDIVENCPAIYLNPTLTKGSTEALYQTFQEKVLTANEHQEAQVPIILHRSDAAAPMLIAAQQGLKHDGQPLKTAEALMGHSMNPAGNAAIADGIPYAKEENDARVMSGFLEMTLSYKFNKTLQQAKPSTILTATTPMQLTDHEKLSLFLEKNIKRLSGWTIFSRKSTQEKRDNLKLHLDTLQTADNQSKTIATLVDNKVNGKSLLDRIQQNRHSWFHRKETKTYQQLVKIFPTLKSSNN